MKTIDLKSPEFYFDRELSWLEFDQRVMEEGMDPSVPLLERAKFLAIAESNLDEFFMIRVAGIRQQAASKIRRRTPAGMTPVEQLEAIAGRVRRLVDEHTEAVGELLELLRGQKIIITDSEEWTIHERRYLEGVFREQLLPLLTPIAMPHVEKGQIPEKPTLLGGLRLHLAMVLEPLETTSSQTNQNEEKEDETETARHRYAVVPVPTNYPRFLDLPEPEEGIRLARLEDVIGCFAEKLFPGYRILRCVPFRITRDADVAIADDDAEDLLQMVEEAVLDRRRRRAVRLEISSLPSCRCCVENSSDNASSDPSEAQSTQEDYLSEIRQWLGNLFQLEDSEIYQIPRMLDITSFWQLVGLSGFDHLRTEQWPPCEPRDLIGVSDEEFFDTLAERDFMLVFPYEKFDPIIRFVRLAAEDPSVLAIKQTLYRTSGDSPIIAALEKAATNGKEVTVLVEIKARFDEARNVQWARRLEDAGCHVIYGIAGLKTHAKSLLVIRREQSRIRRYAHLATGNFNDKTARIYSDIGLMTSDSKITADLASFFNLLTGYSESVGWSILTVEPVRLKERFIELIDREIKSSTGSHPGHIMAKVNSLEHPEIIRALYRASQAGIRVQLNVRGICMLKPGVEGVSDNIEVRSIVDRFLEHARVFYFHNGGQEEVYLSSADWMRRNLEKRFEILFPVLASEQKRRVIETLRVYFSDTVKARRLLPEGRYVPIEEKDFTLRAQEFLYHDTMEATKHYEEINMRYKPLISPNDPV
jgi:polyphosphate kinase